MLLDLSLQRGNPGLRAIQGLLLEHGLLHQEIERIGLIGGGALDQSVGFGILADAAKNTTQAAALEGGFA